MKLRLARDLALPVDAATQTFLNVGKRGSGKSTTAARLVEQLLKAGVPVAVLDPVDTWFGLKSSRDGAGAGHDVYVFGGRHADLPLEPGGGTLIADVLCEHRVPMVLSCKHLSGRARGQFMADFATTLFQKWSGGVLHLVLEEAHELAPQQPQSGEEQMLGAFKRLWKLARSSGIGGTAITQRPASLHKDITTQAEILIVHRTIGPQDVAAVREWIRYHQQGEDILPELSKLKTGEAFVWAPEFPEDAPIGLKRVQMLPRETFDSSATPKHGEQRAEPKTLAAVDLERLRTKMAATIERAKAEDPKELRARIRQLEQDLKKAATKSAPTTITPSVTPRVREVAVLKDAQVARLETAVAHAMGAADRVVESARKEYQRALDVQAVALKKGEEVLAALKAARREGEPVTSAARKEIRSPSEPTRPQNVARTHGNSGRNYSPRTPRESAGNGDARLPKAQQRIVDSIGWLEGVGIPQPDKTQVSLFADLTPDAGHTVSMFGALRTAGLIDYPTPGFVALTDAGRQLADTSRVPQSAEEMQAQVLAKLPKAQRSILEVLIPAHPKPMEKGEVATQAGLTPDAGHTVSMFGRLRSLGLIDYPRPGQVVARPVLFLERV